MKLQNKLGGNKLYKILAECIGSWKLWIMNRRLEDLRQKNKYKCEVSNQIKWKLYKILAECIGSWKFWIMNRRLED